MADCPDDTELAGFLNDSLGAERLAGVSGHVDRCPLCQARLDRLTDQSDGAVARYRELSSGELPNASSGVVSSPEAATQILGAKPVVSVFGAKPVVPGFEIVAEIGRGGMGVVFKARHRRLNRLVALKMILAGGAADPRMVQRFLFEGEVLARVQHPQVVTVFEVDTYEGPNRVAVPYLAMELLEGGSLSRRLRDANDGAAPRPTPRAAAELVGGLARAVHAAHLQGVIHRDLKPGNILFPSGQHEARNSKPETTTEGPPVSGYEFRASDLSPKVTDFGLAKFTQDAGAELTQSGQIVGTPQYMAPEQASGERTMGPAVDVYALGAILFECLAGRPPFTGTEPMSVMLKVINEAPPDVRSLRPEVHRDLAAVTMKCLAKEPRRRYSSAEALAEDLGRFLDGRPTKARPVTNFERLWLSARRNPTVAALLAALALVLSTAFVVVAVLWVRAEKQARTEEGLRQWAEGRARTEVELREEAQAANARAGAETKERQRHEARLEFAQAVEWCEDGRVVDGLALFVRAIELADATGDAPLARAARINLAAWSRDLPKPARRFKHGEQPRLVAFHPDRKHMVSAGRGRELYLWDTAAPEKPVRIYKPAPVARALFGTVVGLPTYWAVDISPDGRLIAAGGTDGSVTIWETANETHRANFPLPDPPKVDRPPGAELNTWTLAFTGDRVLWTNDGANGLRKWDVADFRKPTSARFVPLSGAKSPELQIMVAAPDRRRLYTGDRAGYVREWDVATGAERRNWHIKGWVTDVAVSPDATRLAATGTDAVVSVFDLTAPARAGTGDEKPLLEIGLAGTYGNGVAFAPKRPYLVASDNDGNVRFWHRDTGQVVGLARQFHGEVTRMRFRPDSDEFAVPAGDSVHLCALPDPSGDLLSPGRKVRIRGLDFAPKSDRLVVADDWGVGLFDLRRKGEATALALDGEALTVRFDPNPERPRVLRGTRKGFDRFAVPAGTFTPGAPFIGGRLQRLEFSRDGSVMYAMATVAVARYDLATLAPGPVKRPAEKLPAGVELSALAVRPDGSEVFVSFGDSAAILKGDTLAPLRTWDIEDEVLDARYTPDGKLILLGRRSGAAELRDSQTGTRVGPQMPHYGAITGVAVAPSGEVLLTGSRDGTARFWDAATGLSLGAPLGHAGAVTHVAFAPNGEHVATGTDTGHVMLWDVPPPPLAGTLEELQARFGPGE